LRENQRVDNLQASSSTAMVATALLTLLAATHAFGPQTTRRRLPRLSRRAEEKTGLDAIDELLPRFRRDDGAVDLPRDEAKQSGGAEMGSVNDKLLNEINEAKKGFRVEAPQVDDREIVDISDVNPVQSLLSGVAALATAYVFWVAVSWAAGSFDKHPIDSDIYAIQRISTVMRTVVLGSGTLLTGITAFAGVGLLALGGKVALGGGDDGE
jgi:hypothetical protein